jgi:anti-sigma B factor antagonist
LGADNDEQRHGSPDDAFAIGLHGAGASLTVVLSGKVDGTNADDLAATLTRAMEGRPGRLVVDLAGVTSFGSAGIRCLLEVNAWARRAGVRFLVARPSVVVEDVVETTGAGDLLTIQR